MKKFDHIGIVFKNAATGRKVLSDALGVDRWTAVFEDPVNDVVVQFGIDPDQICYELIAPLSEKSPIRHALHEGINIVNHTAYLVDDLAVEAKRLKRAGFVATSKPKAAIAYGGHLIQFFISHDRVLFELIEAPEHRHVFELGA
jgi:methylmalonyl-CoA/ethylmalonyl-CoA epimerase